MSARPFRPVAEAEGLYQRLLTRWMLLMTVAGSIGDPPGSRRLLRVAERARKRRERRFRALVERIDQADREARIRELEAVMQPAEDLRTIRAGDVYRAAGGTWERVR